MKIVEQMLARYPQQARSDALREIMQEIALLSPGAKTPDLPAESP